MRVAAAEAGLAEAILTYVELTIVSVPLLLIIWEMEPAVAAEYVKVEGTDFP